MGASSAATAALALSPSPGDYSPFTCLLIDHKQSVRVDWDGTTTTRETLDSAPLQMLTSSSLREDEVRAQRMGAFSEHITQPEAVISALDAFHCHTQTDGDHWTPMMKRPKSLTKSITRVRVSLDTVEMSYWRRDSAIAPSERT